MSPKSKYTDEDYLPNGDPSRKAHTGKFRVIERDTFDDGRWMISDPKTNDDFGSLEAAKNCVAKRCVERDGDPYCYLYIFDDTGQQVWVQTPRNQ